jgi:metallo-beta-lactamase family protein
MQLTFCGAAQTTTGSQHLLEVNGRRILLDCGLFQGHRAESHERNLNFLFDPTTVDCVVLSHAHIDHSGNLPNLCRRGFTGNIYSTHATRDLCQVMLEDCAKIQAHDIRWLNKHAARNGKPPLEPLYSALDADRAMQQFVTVGYDRPIPVAEGVRLTFIDAGHILGSAQIVLDIEEMSSGRSFRFVFSGDIGRGGHDILRDPVLPRDVDYLLMESTYGDREHELNAGVRERMAQVIRQSIRDKGKVIIPSFAVERTQHLIYALHQLVEGGDIPEIPVFVDSPLAVSATEIYRLHPECFNTRIYEFLMEKRNPFGFDSLELIRSVPQSKELNHLSGPAVIISASGMCESGRILHHLRNHIDDHRNTVLFVGYCAPNTLGRRIRDGATTVPILGDIYPVKARVEVMDSFSGHADRSELIAYFQGLTGSLKKVWLVHGEPDQSASLATALQDLHRAGAVSVAQWRSTTQI